MDRKLKIGVAALVAGASLFSVVRWLRSAPRPAPREPERNVDEVELAGVESFPASDPPGWTLGEKSRAQ